MDDTLKFKDLKVGDKFIAMPIPGDNKGHGGFKKTYWILMKIEEVPNKAGSELNETAVRQADNGFVYIPDNQEVIHIA